MKPDLPQGSYIFAPSFPLGMRGAGGLENGSETWLRRLLRVFRKRQRETESDQAVV